MRKNDYRRIFQQFEKLQRDARRAARKLDKIVPIANFDEFASACATQAAMADKIIAVATRDYFPTLTVARLEPVIAEFKLDIPVTKRDGRDALEFRSAPEHRWRILRLVDDDYLRSSLTDHRYEVNSKTAPLA